MEHSGTGPSGSAPWAIGQTGPGWGGLPLDPTSVLFVSLFLMLFAFFAVLNSNASERPHEANEVMKSLQAAFGGQGTNSLPAAGSDPGDHIDGATQLLKARQRFAADLPHVEFGRTAGDDQFEASIALESFFLQNTSRVAPSRELFLKSLATISSEVSQEPLGITIEFAGLKTDFDEQRRVAALAAILGKYGIPSGRVSIVSADVAAGRINLVVRRG